jgi:hypothetical protein
MFAALGGILYLALVFCFPEARHMWATVKDNE